MPGAPRASPTVEPWRQREFGTFQMPIFLARITAHRAQPPLRSQRLETFGAWLILHFYLGCNHRQAREGVRQFRQVTATGSVLSRGWSRESCCVVLNSMQCPLSPYGLNTLQPSLPPNLKAPNYAIHATIAAMNATYHNVPFLRVVSSVTPKPMEQHMVIACALFCLAKKSFSRCWLRMIGSYGTVTGCLKRY